MVPEPLRAVDPARPPRTVSSGHDRGPAANLRRAEHDRAPARGPGEGAGTSVRAGVRRPGGRVPPAGRPRRGPSRACRARGAAGAARRHGPRAGRRDRRPRPRLRLRPAARRRRRRDPAPSGQAGPGGGARGAGGVDPRPRHPDAGADRGARARSRAATPSGSGPTCSSSGGRCGRTTTGPTSSPTSGAATRCGSSTSRTGRGRRSSSTCCQSSRRWRTTWPSSSCRCSPRACTRCWRTSAFGWSRSPRRSTSPSAATSSRSDPGSSSSRTATR